MNYFLKNLVILLMLLSSVNIFAQQDDFDVEQKKIFQPKFTLGSGIYTLSGDIENKDSGLLKGEAGINAGMKFDITKNIDLSFLIIKTSFSGDNGSQKFSSDIDGYGLLLGYTLTQLFNLNKISPIFSLGVQSFSVRNGGETSNAILVPIGFGLRMNVTKRLQFDIAINYGFGLSDIDMVKINTEDVSNSDGYKALNFIIHYDLFTANKKVSFDDSYYADVDFAKLESEDEDGDFIRDMDDYCPQTPSGVRVDNNGCPLDNDKDGIPDYIDQQKNTLEGSIVDENGVALPNDKYQNTNLDFDVASRKYAKFYNDLEIKRENYKTIDEYLIAKANAFNKAFNESLNENAMVKGLIYKIKIAEYTEGIPANIANKLLSLDDLESFIMDDDAIIYTVGDYNTLDEAKIRMFSLEDIGFSNVEIIVYNNGEISDYSEAKVDIEIDVEEIVKDSNFVESFSENDSITEELIKETNYRVQLGAFNKKLPKEVFIGVNNVNFFTGSDGLVRYTAGSFVDYKNALDYQAQMKARGFNDAFIVTYKNGERISLNVAIKNTKKYNTQVEDVKAESIINENLNVKDSTDNIINLQFTVQILVTEGLASEEDVLRMSAFENIDNKSTGSEMYEYYAGNYLNLKNANDQLDKVKLAGFKDAFVFATNNGERISLEQAKELLK
jgi:hypothetical protein